VLLDGPRAEQRVGVLATLADGSRRDVSRRASFRLMKPVARLDAGLLRPESDGAAELSIQVGGVSATIPVEVKGSKADRPTSFVREVVPLLTRHGCNSGACHGSQHGKGGFRLSLFGFDPASDHEQILRSAKGRRVVLSSPERSILLAKPAGVMEHAGGERFRPGSRPYSVLLSWLEDGAPGPLKAEPALRSLDVWPAKRLLIPGEKQQIIVTAAWSDGRSEDVTASAQFDALNESVAAATPDGLMTGRGAGESHVMVRFAGLGRVVQATLPYAAPRRSAMPAHNFIDERLKAKWEALGLSPSPLADDAAFLRRVHLDAIGTVPTPREVRAFLADADPRKRAKLIDRLLERPEFVDWWALKWGDLLRINRDLLQDKGMWSFHNWVRASLRDGKPADKMAREILTARGSTFTEGPANFFRASRSPADWSETATQLFMGVRIQCAKCHTHPFEKWTQEDYWGMAAFFARLGTKTSQEFGLFERETVVYPTAAGEARHPRKGGVVKPKPLGGDAAEDEDDRRQALAAWLGKKGNPFFARNLANRFWAYAMGRGLVEPIDDLRETNPPTNPELLDALAKELEDGGFDLKKFLRTIFESRAYQLSSSPAEGNRADATNAYFARYARKRLTAEQLADAIDDATGTREKYPGLPLGTRAIQLPDTKVRSFLLDVFGRPARQVTCECERTAQPNLAQALHLLNGDFLNRKIEDAKGRVAELSKRPVAEIVEELHVAALGRLPSERERAWGLAWIRKAATVREGAQDLLWVLVNRREFQFVP
ncbi:MAG: DUF1549 and DUF1553 domain-containing protein, partial [Gemmataceae bacterium]|nr:DUF1549 and DUF1553 domain-containing protein [Gemmataceae bacterium]